MLTASKDNQIYIWSIIKVNSDEYQFKLKIKLKKVHLGDINQIEFSPDSTMFLTCSKDRTVRCYDSTNGNVLSNCIKHTDAVFGVAWYQNSQNFLSISTDGTLKCWNINGQMFNEVSTCRGRSVFTSKDDSKAYVVSACEPTIQIIDLKLGNITSTLKDNDIFVDADISSCRNFLIVNISIKKPEIHIWDLQQKLIVQRFSGYA